MSEEQREWKQQLANSREDVKVKLDEILHELARNLRDAKKPSKLDIGIQTDNAQETVSIPSHQSSMILANNVDAESSSDREISAPGQNSIMERPLPHEAEQLRAELAASSAHIVLQESSIRSLQQSTLSLRRSLDEYYRERERFMIQLRHAQAEEFTHRSVRDRTALDLERATMEVERLRDEIRAFHHPNSRTYQSVKDAVQREMRGEAPMTPIVLKRTIDTQMDGVDEGAERARKRQKGSATSSPARPQVSSTAQPPRPQRNFMASDLPRLTTDIEPFVQIRPAQSAGLVTSVHGGQPSAARTAFNQAPMSAPPFRQAPRFIYHFQGSGNENPVDQSGHQGSQNFVRIMEPTRRLSQLPPGVSFIQPSRQPQQSQSQPHPPSHPPSVSHPMQSREQNGQGHSRSRSFPNAHPTAPAPSANPNSGQPLSQSQALASHPHLTLKQSPPRPRSPLLGVTIPAGWQPNDWRQQGGNGDNPSSGYRPRQPSFSSAGHPMIQRSVPVTFSQVIDLSSPMTMDRDAAPKENKNVPTDINDPSAQRFCLLLYEVNHEHGMLKCRMCGRITPVPKDNGLMDAFTHSLTHREFFDLAYEKAFPPPDKTPRGPQ